MLHIKPSILLKLKFLLGIMFMLGVISPIAIAAMAPEFELLQSLGKQEGSPSGKLIQDANGNLYGTTQFGGSNGLGAVYKIDTSGNYSALHSFDESNRPSSTSGVIQGSDGKLYGATRGVAATIYQLDISGATPVYTVLYHFADYVPDAGIIQASDGNIYGITSGEFRFIAGNSFCSGFCPFISGTLFQLKTTGGAPVFTVLNSFIGGGHYIERPSTSMVQGSDGKLYGMSIGISHGIPMFGSLFQLDISLPTPVFKTLQSLEGNLENSSAGVLSRGSDGKIYGSTLSNGAANLGTVFSIDTSGATPVYSLLHSFPFHGTFDQGGSPSAGLIQGSDGKFYGITGYNDLARYVMFQLDLSGPIPVYTVLHAFDDGGGQNRSLIQGSDGKFYGTMTGGTGSVFQLDISGGAPVYSVLHKFDAIKGKAPSGNLIQGRDGKLYGTTNSGGSGLVGTIFQLDPTGEAMPIYSVLHEFDGNKGSTPQSGVIQGRDGKLYGTTNSGGSFDKGTVFRLDPYGPQPNYSILHEFDGIKESIPQSGVIQGSDGKLYGTTGDFSKGSVFQIDISGLVPTYSVLRYFSDPGQTNHASSPGGGLIQSSKGMLYGTLVSISNFDLDKARVFQIDISRATPIYSFLHEFDRTNEDFNSSTATLIQGSGGKLYGTTDYGGSFDKGTVFQIETNGSTPVKTVLHNFDGVNEVVPSLIQGIDGKLYGINASGGNANNGTIIQIDTAGSTPIYTVLHHFDRGIPPSFGMSPGQLTQSRDGKLYGTTASSNGTNEGTVFQLDITGATPVYTVLHEFEANKGGTTRLIQASDGNLYGTNNGGGQFGGGVIYRIKLYATPVNTPPVATNDSYALTVPQNNKPATVAAPGVLKNDKDGEGDKLTVVGATASKPIIIKFRRDGGKVSLFSDGHFIYTPAKKCFHGTQSFTYKVTDGKVTSNSATVTLTTKQPSKSMREHDEC